MSLVLEALRRVEKTDARTGSIGASVASYRPARKPRGSAIPLLLGLLTGGAAVLLFGTPPRNSASVSAQSQVASPAGEETPFARGRAGLPPPLILEPVAPAALTAAAGPDRRGEKAPPQAQPRPSLVLQAISERDSHPIAIINDQLVKEGDRLGPVRVLRIGPDSVEVLLENGKNDTVRFAPPPPPEASPSPDPG